MYTTKSGAKNTASENHLHIWQKYRPTSSINFSDIVEDRTIYDETRTDVTFDPNEISGNSSTCSNNNNNQHKRTDEPEFDADAVSVDDILGNSIVHEIRHLSQSRQGGMFNASLPIDKSMSRASGISFGCVASESLLKESFRSGEEVLNVVCAFLCRNEYFMSIYVKI